MSAGRCENIVQPAKIIIIYAWVFHVVCSLQAFATKILWAYVVAFVFSDMPNRTHPLCSHYPDNIL
jgi:hypothetical protein